MSSDSDEKLEIEWSDRKSSLMETLLGKEHDHVMHAIIPFFVGGSLDLYYYPHAVKGTAIATKELSERQGQGATNAVFKNYELVMFTRHTLDLKAAKDENTDLGRVHSNIGCILNYIARFAYEATLNPQETCEFPEDFENVGGKCLVFDAYPTMPEGGTSEFGLLAIIEIFREEMEFARENRSDKLFERLKAKGQFPYSDMDRKSVV